VKITLVISSLNRGGAEKVLACLANHLAQHDYHVSILTWDSGEHAIVYPLDASVSNRALDLQSNSSNLWTAFQANLSRIRQIRKAICSQAPDIIISFGDTTNVVTLMANITSGIPVIVAERSDPAILPKEVVWRFLRRCCYPLADRIIVQTEEAKSFFMARPYKLAVIPNPVSPQTQRPIHSVESQVVLGIGRLVPEKRFDLLIRAFAALKDKYPLWKLRILGAGPCRLSLESLTESLHMTSRIEFLGDVFDIGAFLKKASVFVLPSDFEGFPNALCEAMSYGVASIATATTGSKAIIRNGIDGVLIPVGDLSRLTGALDQLLGDVPLRHRLGQRAVDVCERFSERNILGMWEDVISQVGYQGKDKVNRVIR
jgi:GalNAc-alpha-(1->4)-GalNAc-alpha-(1->3)-diNAcBac-PP-undecaprenol alpha-1,4-N-acetyl-D-galactosaminyltransferase